MSILIIFIIIIVLLEASVSLVLAKINVITFKGKESIGSGKKSTHTTYPIDHLQKDVGHRNAPKDCDILDRQTR